MKGKHSSKIDAVLTSQIKFWKQQKIEVEKIDESRGAACDRREPGSCPFITISREYGCGGYEVAEALAGILNSSADSKAVWAAYDRGVLEMIGEDLGLTRELADTLTSKARGQFDDFFKKSFSAYPTQITVYRTLSETVRTLATNGHVIIVGRGGNIITRDMPNGFNVRLVAPLEWKAERIAKIMDMKKKDAEKLVVKKDRERVSFFQEFAKFNIADPNNYHLVLNNERFSSEEAAAIINRAFRALYPA